MEAGDTHVPPPVWGNDSYAAGRGLPPRPNYRREAVGPRVVAASWKDDLEARFALVDRVEEAGPIDPAPTSSRSFEDLVPTVYSTYSFHI